MYRHPDQLQFKPRYRIKGVLTAATKLHIGDGGTATGRIPKREDKKTDAGNETEYSTVCTNHAGEPYIPASTLKGAINARLKNFGLDDAALRELLGEELDGTPVKGGRLLFRNANLKTKSKPGNSRQYWSDGRCTCIEPHVVIDPRTGTAAEHLLYHVEFVPENTTFDFECEILSGSEHDVKLVLRGLDTLGGTNELLELGSGTGNNWGQLSWALSSVEYAPAEQIKDWITKGAATPLPFTACQEDWAAAARAAFPCNFSPPTLTLSFTLNFQGGLIIHDPTQVRTKVEKPVGHAHVRNNRGEHAFPEESFRGPFRAQMARIWRTLEQGRAAASSTPPLEEAKGKDDPKKLHPFLKLAGAPGWKSPISFRDLKLEGGKEFRQEMVAIDRFTGGGADERKFAAEGVYQPTLTGKIVLDLKRLEIAGDWVALLLLWTLRDLVEGDIRFGHGKSKGFGHCTGSITASGVPEHWQAAFAAFPFGKQLDEALVEALEAWQTQLHEQIQQGRLPDQITTGQRGA